MREAGERLRDCLWPCGCTATYHQLGHFGPRQQHALEVVEKVFALNVARHQDEGINVRACMVTPTTCRVRQRRLDATARKAPGPYPFGARQGGTSRV